MYDRSVFDDIIKDLRYVDIKAFANTCLNYVPDYFYKVPASSSGKYHPAYALGEGGLVRHTLATCRIVKHLLEIESIAGMFTPVEKDLVIVAAMLHDTFKCGDKSSYEANPHTKFNHPLIASAMYSNIKGIINNDCLQFLCGCISSHMGQWNVSKAGELLPKPKNYGQILVHVADYLASRKDIILNFD